jgi:hypothetical protein
MAAAAAARPRAARLAAPARDGALNIAGAR